MVVGPSPFLIVEAADQARVQQFMQPFAEAGGVKVLPASHCEAVVGRGTCDAI
jgi:hypothetical protein